MTTGFLTNISQKQLLSWADQFGTPAYFYDRQTIEKRIAELKGFDVIRYAQKAASNLALLALMRKNVVVVDAVSAGEVHRALRAGYHSSGNPPEIVFTADLLDDDAEQVISDHKIAVNAGSPGMIQRFGQLVPGGDLYLRINPGFGHGHSRKVNTGGDLSKHGIWHEQLEQCLQMAADAGVKFRGLHMHIGSGSDLQHLAKVCDAMVAAAEVAGKQIDSISAGGGIPIPYQPNGNPMDLKAYFSEWDKARKKIEAMAGHEISLEVEPGRFLVAESSFLLTRVREIKTMGEHLFYLIDAGFDTLIRPAMYGAFHHISIIPHDGRKSSGEVPAVVAGPLCESCDVFTQEEGGFVKPRMLPEAKEGDLLILHDTGAYGSVMSSNYNTRKLAPEILLQNGEAELIRERQSFEDIMSREKIPASI